MKMNDQKSALYIADFASQIYKVERLHSERERFAEIVEREMAARKLKINGDERENDPVDMFLCSRLFLFSAMTGVAPIYERPNENPVRLCPGKPERLHLLRIRGSCSELWPDENLYRVFMESLRGKRHGLPGYKQNINELGMTFEVIEYQGHPVTYDAWVKYNGDRLHPTDNTVSVKGPPPSRLSRTICKRVNTKILEI